MTGRFRLKGDTVEAFQWRADTPRPAWFIDAIEHGEAWYEGAPEPHYTIRTRGGNELRAVEGDWIVRGPRGDLYPPCSPGVFANAYEPLAPIEPETSGPQDGPSPHIEGSG